MKNYKDLFVWQKAHALVLATYRVTKNFPKEEMYNLTSQLRRSATSTPTNIAEGCGKFTQRDFAHYLQISFGSAQESEYLIFLSFELGYMSLEEFKNLDTQVGQVKAMLLGLLGKVRRDEDVKPKKIIKK
jgi:four helix bundle protein